MSLVVAYKKNGIIYMGADTQTTQGTTVERFMNESGYKITRLPNGMLVGICGRVKCHQKIIARKGLFDIPDNVKFDKRYIVRNMIPEICEITSLLKDDKGARNVSMDVSMVLAWKDKMFVITHYFDVYECNTYVAIGAGDDYSKYELSKIGENDDVNEGLLRALRVGAYFDTTVSAPFILIDTKNREYKVVEK